MADFKAAHSRRKAGRSVGNKTDDEESVFLDHSMAVLTFDGRRGTAEMADLEDPTAGEPRRRDNR